MIGQSPVWGFRGMISVGLLSFSALAAVLPAPAGADTDPATLVGAGGSFLTPVTDVLLKADSGLSPLFAQYDDANLDNSIGAFVGAAPNSFTADFAVSERPLTSAEAQTAKADGRTFAYVPFASTPVAVATLVASGGLLGNSTSVLCQDIPLTVALVGSLFTNELTNPSVSPNAGLPNPLAGWGDPRLTQAGGAPIPNSGIFRASTLEPSAENSALMALLDSDPTAKELLDNALNNPTSHSLTTSDTPSETWPFHEAHAVVGGDLGLIEKELSINPKTNTPALLTLWTGLGFGGGGNGGAEDVFPLSSVWTGAPTGSPWNIPTAAIQNAAKMFVAPSEAAAAASEADATMDPTTNLVTFAANPNNASAYNNYLMVESYLVVPTSGLTAAKASKLAQYIRFIVGPVAQSDEITLGSAPPTKSMVAADLKVAAALDAEAATTSASQNGGGGASTTTTTSATSATTTTVAVGASSPTSASTGNTGNSGSSAASLASTGAANIVPLLGLGGILIGLGAAGRRRLQRLQRSEVPR